MISFQSLWNAGGHDGITKSLTLKSSRCLGVNTLLIEGSPNNYRTLKNTRPYDWTVNAALCDGDFIIEIFFTDSSKYSRSDPTKPFCIVIL